MPKVLSISITVLVFAYGATSACGDGKKEKPFKLESGKYTLTQKVNSEAIAAPQTKKGEQIEATVEIAVTEGKVKISYVDGDFKGLAFKGTIRGNQISIDAKTRKGLQTYRKAFEGKLVADNRVEGKLSEHDWSLGGADPIDRSTFVLVPHQAAKRK